MTPTRSIAHRLFLYALLFVCVVPLAGCITMPKTGGWLTNHVVTTVDGTRCMTASRWGPMALTGDVNESECAAILEGQRLRAAQPQAGATAPLN